VLRKKWERKWKMSILLLKTMEEKLKNQDLETKLFWKCLHCTLDNTNSSNVCIACGIPNEFPSETSTVTKLKDDMGSGPVSTVLLVEEEKLKTSRVIALNKAKKIVWGLSGVRTVAKFSETELLITTEQEGFLINKNSGERTMHFTGRIQNVILYDK
jgi:hypothetical protein